MNTRARRIRGRLLVKNFRSTLRGYDQEDVSQAYRPGVKLCLERARLYTESWRATEGEPVVLRRAKALAHILQHHTVYISDDELIVGNYASSPQHLTYHPEYYWRWLEKAVGDGYRHLLDDSGLAELLEITRYWRGRSVQGMERDLLPPDLKPYWAYNGATFWGHFAESGVPSYEKIFRLGLNGMIREAEQKLAETERDRGLPAADYLCRRQFLEAAIISLKAAAAWGKRYAGRAREMASATDGQRQAELLRIAAVCDRVPGDPPRSFHEALQSFFFIHLITHLIEAYQNGIGMRFDQVFFPFYSADLRSGALGREQAQELLEALWLKMEEMSLLFAPMLGGGVQGSSLFQTLTLGGVTPEGRDATNDLTFLVIDSCDSMPLSQPTTAIRIHRGTPHKLLSRITESVRIRWGTLSLFNDEYVVTKLLGLGIPLDDARQYGIEQCMRWTIPGKNIVYRAGDGMIVLPKCLELVLSRGVDKFSGKQLGLDTGDPMSFTSIDQVLDAVVSQVGFFAERMARITGVADALYETHLPRPFLTALFDDGIERASDCRKWTYYPKRVMGFLGPIDTANALAAMKRLVFDSKKVSMNELVDAAKNNFKHHDSLRQVLLHGTPKFGNDDDYVDLMARELQCRATREVEKQRSCHGGHFLVDGSSGSAYYAFTQLCGATPDGRLDRTLVGDGTASPVAGTDTKGPTAVLNSVAKLDPLASYNHLLNQKFLPQLLSGEGAEAFESYLRTWCQLGIHHIQFNLIDRDTLLQAVEHPEEYSNLVVRVAGYSAYFVDLARPLQDEIIRRTEQVLGR